MFIVYLPDLPNLHPIETIHFLEGRVKPPGNECVYNVWISKVDVHLILLSPFQAALGLKN